MVDSLSNQNARQRIHITGSVQGVGFRPFVYRLACEFDLTGCIYNDAIGVCIEVQGANIDKFISQIIKRLPRLANIENLTQQKIPYVKNENLFVIKKSQVGIVTAKVQPDAAICDVCITECFDPHARYYYYYYPLLNCTDCGGRYTLTQNLPYDRHHTTLNQFSLCTACLRAYHDPTDRRYHSQSMACAQCGPQYSHTIEDMAQAIRAGKIIAVKGVGGYQFICDARQHNVIKRLRRLKHREQKPYAVMVLNLTSARAIAQCDEIAANGLTSPGRPIVILPKFGNALPSEIAPDLSTVGMMLPSSALHYCLFHQLLGAPSDMAWLHQINDIVLLMTSANMGGCPMIKDDNQAFHKLNDVADMIVKYNRAIVASVDDSVVNIIDEKINFIRRARGYTPIAIPLPHAIPSTLALGGYLKNTVCVTRGDEAFVSHHIGDLHNQETLIFYHQTIKHLLKILDVTPACVAHDYHPDFYSTQIAKTFNVPTIAVQHHHAHCAAVAVEYSVQDAIGLVLDGFGLGEHGQNWGGELIHYLGIDYRHLGSLQPLAQPGGDKVVKQPWRMGASVLFALGLAAEIPIRFKGRRINNFTFWQPIL